MSQVSMFVDPPTGMEHPLFTKETLAHLFEEMGVLAYEVIFYAETAEAAMLAQEVEQYQYNSWTSWLSGPLDEEDREIDMGPEENDDYGGDWCQLKDSNSREFIALVSI